MKQKLLFGRIQNNFPYFVFRQPGNGSQYGRGELTTSTTNPPTPRTPHMIIILKHEELY
jgi:hypothetical protein